jgi:hypothetical protein
MPSSKSHTKKSGTKKSHTHTKTSHSLSASGKRSFTINHAYHVDGCPTKFSHADYTGRYKAHTPQRAAEKALIHLCHVKRIRGQCTLYIEMRETTQGSAHKVFAYKVKRIRYATPKVVGDRTYYYGRHAESVERVPTEKCPGSHKSSGRMVGSHSKIVKARRRNLIRKTKKSGSGKSKKSMTRNISNAVRSTMKRVSKML